MTRRPNGPNPHAANVLSVIDGRVAAGRSCRTPRSAQRCAPSLEREAPMGKHGSADKPVARDAFPTPTSVTEALLKHISVGGRVVWEFGVHLGQMAEPLKARGAEVRCTDIYDYGYPLDCLFDFLSNDDPPFAFDDIISNPPYGHRCRLITPIIEAGLRRLGPNGVMALLLPVDCDSAEHRLAYFGSCSEFDLKIVINKRIVWFERTDGKRACPKENHARYVWRRSRRPRKPVICYEPNK
jgi:hypothetical protein